MLDCVERHSRAVGCITFLVHACCCRIQPCTYPSHEVCRNSSLLFSFSTLRSPECAAICQQRRLLAGEYGWKMTRRSHVTATPLSHRPAQVRVSLKSMSASSLSYKWPPIPSVQYLPQALYLHNPVRSGCARPLVLVPLQRQWQIRVTRTQSNNQPTRTTRTSSRPKP